MRNSYISTLCLSLMAICFCACSYEYEYPDYAKDGQFTPAKQYRISEESSVASLVISVLEQLSYEVASTDRYIVEKDENGNVLSDQKTSGSTTYTYTAKSSTSIMEYHIRCYGWKDGNYFNEKELACTIVFNLANCEVDDNTYYTTYVVKYDSPHEIIKPQ